MIKYLGSKRALIPLITEVIGALSPPCRVLDLFSGTARVGHALKARGYAVTGNDHNTYAEALATCYVQADAEAHADRATAILRELATVPGAPGWFTDTYCVQSRYFQPHNGARIEAIRDAIERMALDPDLRAVLIVALMEAADRVDSTVGVQMAYLKQWAPRATRDLELRTPRLLPRAAAGPGRALRREAIDAAGEPADVCYIDPPYNQHKYLGNYHVWETLVRWDHPDVYGAARKRIDCRERRSAFNAKGRATAALAEVVAAVRAPHLVVSFNDEGYVARDALEGMLRPRGELTVFEVDFPRYVGARIGLHNPRGERVGSVGRLRNTELLYVVTPDAESARRLRALPCANRGILRACGSSSRSPATKTT